LNFWFGESKFRTLVHREREREREKATGHPVGKTLWICVE
jgi:hypothetical protein